MGAVGSSSVRTVGFQAKLKVLKFPEDAGMLQERWSLLWTSSLGICHRFSPPQEPGIAVVISWRWEWAWEPLERRGHGGSAVLSYGSCPASGEPTWTGIDPFCWVAAAVDWTSSTFQAFWEKSESDFCVERWQWSGH